MIKFKADIVGPRNRYVKIVKYMGKTVRSVRRRSVGYIPNRSCNLINRSDYKSRFYTSLIYLYYRQLPTY